MIDIEKVSCKIKFIEKNLSKLKVLKDTPLEEFLSDFKYVEAAKYLLQITIESMLDIAAHIVSKQRLGIPETSVDAFKILMENNIISDKNFEKYRVMIKFRNKVVHVYEDINEQGIYRILQENLPDYESFISEIAKIL